MMTIDMNIVNEIMSELEQVGMYVTDVKEDHVIAKHYSDDTKTYKVYYNNRCEKCNSFLLQEGEYEVITTRCIHPECEYEEVVDLFVHRWDHVNLLEDEPAEPEEPKFDTCCGNCSHCNCCHHEESTLGIDEDAFNEANIVLDDQCVENNILQNLNIFNHIKNFRHNRKHR